MIVDVSEFQRAHKGMVVTTRNGKGIERLARSGDFDSKTRKKKEKDENGQDVEIEETYEEPKSGVQVKALKQIGTCVFGQTLNRDDVVDGMDGDDVIVVVFEDYAEKYVCA